MKEDMIYLHTDSKKGVQYLMEKNKLSIYIYYPKDISNTKLADRTFVITTAICVALYFLFLTLNTEPMYALFYVGIIKREVRMIIIITTILVQILLVLLFYKRNFTKAYIGHKQEIEMSLEDKKKLLLKSLTFYFCIAFVGLGIGVASLVPLSISFIEHASAVMYIWVLLISSIFIRYPFVLIKVAFVPVLKFYIRLLMSKGIV